MHSEPTDQPLVVHAYIRVSGEQQAETRLGLDSQQEAIRRACDSRGYVIAGWHEDAAKSGRTCKRKGLQGILDIIQPGEGLIVAKLDRFSRSVRDFATLVERAKKEGWVPICLDPDLDLATPNGKLVANLIVSVSQWEADITGERTRAALAAKRARGEYVGGKPHITGQLARDIQSMRAAGMTFRGICASLEARGVPTPCGGVSWRPSSLQGVLTSGRTTSPMSQSSIGT